MIGVGGVEAREQTLVVVVCVDIVDGRERRECLCAEASIVFLQSMALLTPSHRCSSFTHHSVL